MHQVKRLECKSIDPLYTSHEFPKQYVHIMGQNAHVFFHYLMPWSCLTTLFWTIILTHHDQWLKRFAHCWKNCIIIDKWWERFNRSLFWRRAQTWVSNVCMDDIQWFSFKSRSKGNEKITFHDVQCVVMCFLVQTATLEFSKNDF